MLKLTKQECETLLAHSKSFRSRAAELLTWSPALTAEEKAKTIIVQHGNLIPAVRHLREEMTEEEGRAILGIISDHMSGSGKISLTSAKRIYDKLASAL